jgi:hypothetical protein
VFDGTHLPNSCRLLWSGYTTRVETSILKTFSKMKDLLREYFEIGLVPLFELVVNVSCRGLEHIGVGKDCVTVSI